MKIWISRQNVNSFHDKLIDRLSRGITAVVAIIKVILIYILTIDRFGRNVIARVTTLLV